jgi:hypothetical protein
VVHFDLKCDNVLLEPLAGVADDDFWAPRSEAPPFRAVIADFGESRRYSSASAAFTVRALSNLRRPLVLMVECFED